MFSMSFQALQKSAELLFPYPASTDTINAEVCGSGNRLVLLLRDARCISRCILQELSVLGTSESHPGPSFSCTAVLRQKGEPIHYFLCVIISK